MAEGDALPQTHTRDQSQGIKKMSSDYTSSPKFGVHLESLTHIIFLSSYRIMSKYHLWFTTFKTKTQRETENNLDRHLFVKILSTPL